MELQWINRKKTQYAIAPDGNGQRPTKWIEDWNMSSRDIMSILKWWKFEWCCEFTWIITVAICCLLTRTIRVNQVLHGMKKSTIFIDCTYESRRKYPLDWISVNSFIAVRKFLRDAMIEEKNESILQHKFRRKRRLQLQHCELFSSHV